MDMSLETPPEEVDTLSVGIGKGPLARLLGSFATIRILDFLTTFRDFDYSVTEIAENVGISWRTAHRVVPKFLEYGLIKESRMVGRSRMYRANMESAITNKLDELIVEIARFDSERIVEAQDTMQVTEVTRGETDSPFSPRKRRKVPVPAEEEI